MIIDEAENLQSLLSRRSSSLLYHRGSQDRRRRLFRVTSGFLSVGAILSGFLRTFLLTDEKVC